MAAAIAMSSISSVAAIGRASIASCSSSQPSSRGNGDGGVLSSGTCQLAFKGSSFVGKRRSLEASIGRLDQMVQGLSIRCSGGFIPAEHRHLYEGVEKLGPDMWNRTYYPKEADHINKDKPWLVVDATDMILGRLASIIAVNIRGKNLPTYSPSTDMGVYVIVVNSEKVKVTGKKNLQKIYRRHSGRPGGMKEETYQALQQRIPERIIEHAVRGMLPKGRLGRRLFTHLKVYKGPKHPHEAQTPGQLKITDKRCLQTAK